MGLTGMFILIAITIGTAFAGCSDCKGQEQIIQKDFRFLKDYDFEKPQSFQSSRPINCINYIMNHKKGTSHQGTLMNRPYQNTEGNYEIMNTDQGSKNIQLLQQKHRGTQKQASEGYPQSFDRNQESIWFQNPKVSVEHVYDLSPKKTIDEDPSQEDNWYQNLQKLLRLMDQMHSDNDCHKHNEAESKKVDGPEREKASKMSYVVEKNLEEEEGGRLDNHDVEPKKIIEHTKPITETLMRTGVPEPLFVKVPVPNTNGAHPNKARESVPVPVALTIYKLVPEFMEKKIPMDVERLVPVQEPNDSIMEESKWRLKSG